MSLIGRWAMSESVSMTVSTEVPLFVPRLSAGGNQFCMK